VQFSNPNHFRTDYVNFVVADFEGTYHTILGRPALTKFMVVPHYSYLVLKMPTEQGVLPLRGNVYTTYNCEEESFKVALKMISKPMVYSAQTMHLLCVMINTISKRTETNFHLSLVT
jgi:hypothetical protein